MTLRVCPILQRSLALTNSVTVCDNSPSHTSCRTRLVKVKSQVKVRVKCTGVQGRRVQYMYMYLSCMYMGNCEGISPHSAPEWLWAKIECNLARTWLRLGGWVAWDARGAVRRLRGSRGATVVIQTCFVCSAWLLVLCAEIFHEYFRL